MIKGKKNWFTLIEVVIVCTVFAIMLVGIIWAINKAYIYMNNTRTKVRATNLAREWVEMMFNIRDTNWRKCSWKKDEFWLYVGTWWDESSCVASNKFTSWTYVLSQWDGTLYASGINSNCYPDFWDNCWDKDSAKISFAWDYNYLSWDDIHTWSMDDLLWNQWDFYRVVYVSGIYDKLSGCSESSCPKEMRFCVKVFYTSNGWKHSSELCSIMTNFAQ